MKPTYFETPSNAIPEAAPAAAVSTSPETGTAETAAAAEPTLIEQLVVAQAEVAAAKERHLRAVADMENFRKRVVREKEELRAYAAARVIEELVPALDNLGLGVAAAKAPNADLQTLIGGIEMVAQQFKSALESNGLQQLDPAGAVFDPNQHEALSQQASDDVPEGTVLHVIRVGYSLNGRLLRPASVIVSGGPAVPPPASAPADPVI